MPERLAPLRLALAQINPTVGDLEGNAAKISHYIERARDAGAELVLFPELALSGYPPEDLLLKEHFLRANAEALTELAAGVEGIVAIVGFPERTEDVFNSIAVIADGAVRTTYRKTRLWNYGVADEERYFQAGPGAAVIDLGGARIGLTVCEDMWVPGAPASEEAEAGAALIVNASASPYQQAQGPAARADAPAAGARQPRRGRVLQHGRRPGRARLRRPLGGDRPRGLRARARASVRRGAVVATVDVQAALTARLRDTRLRPPAQKVLPQIRHAGPLRAARAPARGAHRGQRRRAARARGRGLRRARAPACATTWRRTASGTS